MTTFCIITCTYNAEKELPRTLESVGGQSYGSVCHIIIDGASSDKTVALASAYADNNHSSHTVKVVSEKDNGLYDAMNKGIRLSEGDYILFLNAGDTFADNYTLERIATQISNIGGRELPAVIYGKTDIVDNDGNFLRHRRLQPPETLTWKSFLNGMLVCHQAFYARRDLAQDTPHAVPLSGRRDVGKEPQGFADRAFPDNEKALWSIPHITCSLMVYYKKITKNIAEILKKDVTLQRISNNNQ